MSTKQAQDKRPRKLHFMKGPRDGEKVKVPGDHSPKDEIRHKHLEGIANYRLLARYEDDNEVEYIYFMNDYIPYKFMDTPYYARSRQPV